MSDEKPPEKPTVKFETPPKWMQDAFERLHERMGAGFTAVDVRFGEVEDKVDTVARAVGTVTNEVERVKKDLHEHRGAVDERFKSHSMRARQESAHDDHQDVKLQELENRLAAKTESQTAVLLEKMARTPQGQKVINAVVGLVLMAVAFATMWLAGRAR